VTATPIVRACAHEDFDELVARWHATNRASYPYCAEQQRHTLDDARGFFRGQILGRCRVFVAAEADELVGVIALDAPWVRALAVFPEAQRRGIGSALLREVRAHSPAELRLFTYRRNAPARAFYRRHGFVAVGFGISPAPEREPDVEYRWRA
jgi:ribosomal protein S18 acetylase RimI-like enzyme